MCGIVGYVQRDVVSAEVDDQYREALSSLLFMDTLRGFDSTGVACIPLDKKQAPYLLKKAIPGFAFIDIPEYEMVRAMQTNPGIFIGHNRAATRGIVNDENAHPFVEDHITLVHNGSINNHHSLDSGVISGVDSAHIAGAIAKHGAEKVLPSLDGSAILVWHDAKENSMNIARTRDRAIRWIFDKHGTCWFASEREMLWSALIRNDLSPPKPKFLTLPEFHHYKWLLDKPVEEVIKTTFPEYVPQWKIDQLKREADARERREKLGLGEAQSRAERSWNKHSRDTKTSGASMTCASIACIKPDEPTSKTAIKKVNKKLEAYNLEVGDQLTIRRQQYIPSKKNPMFGDITGYFASGNVAIKCIMKDVPRSVWDRSHTGQYVVHVYNTYQEHLQSQGRHIPVLVVKLKNYGLFELVQGPNGKLIPKDEFNILSADGCFNCRKPVDIADHELLEWAGNAPYCKSCSDDLINDLDKRLVH